MIWKLEDWQFPCYNVNNGRCKALLKWNNSKNIIYEETTNNIIPILSLKRPHSRAFHLSTILIIVIFITQFHLISFDFIKNTYYNEKSNELIKLNLRYSTLYLYIGATISRTIFGYIADKIGVRLSYCIVIIISIISGIININYENNILKILNGTISAGFVLSELWVITMFDTNILGITTGILGGIGNSGVGIICSLNYLAIINLDKMHLDYYIYWPYILLALFIYPIYYLSDDCPYGNYIELKRLYNETHDIEENIEENIDIDNTIYSNNDTNYSLDNNINIENIIVDISFTTNKCLKVLRNAKIIALCLTYLYSFGLELTLYSNLPILLKIEDTMSLDKIIYLLIIFSLINLVGRPLGGYICDKNYAIFKIIGKIKQLLIFTSINIVIGIIINTYIHHNNHYNNEYYYNIILLLIILWSFTNNLIQGTIIGIIPHIDSSYIGVILGYIASFGTIGGILGNILFIYLSNYNAIRFINVFGLITIFLNMLILL